MEKKFQEPKRPCCVTDCCQSGCSDCPYDYSSFTDPSIPAELASDSLIDLDDDLESD
jgi:hypothetical protein